MSDGSVGDLSFLDCCRHAGVFEVNPCKARSVDPAIDELVEMAARRARANILTTELTTESRSDVEVQEVKLFQDL